MNFIELQKKYFIEIGLSYNEALIILNDIYSTDLKGFDKPISQHQILFAAISLKIKVDRVLEIGTLDGLNALFLSKLFKDAKITTLDLPDDNDIFIKTYNRNEQENRKKFILNRDSVISLGHNIEFIKNNSINYLTTNKEKFDLIWVDGAHGSPEVVIDICNSLHSINKNGFIICDDIFTKNIEDDQMYKSTAGFKTLLSFANAGIIKKFNLVIKKFNNIEKFIAVIDAKNIIL